MYCGYITTIKEIRKHSNADRLQVVTVFGNDVIVDLTYHIGKRCIFFPTDGQLSKEFAEDNNLVRKKDDNGNNVGGYLDPDKRNITALKLRGEKSEGLLMPIESLGKYGSTDDLKDGDKITSFNGTEICTKYIPKRKSNKQNSKKKIKSKSITYPYFAEHVDTSQLAYNLKAFKPGDTCYITLKLHGTSGRTSNTIEVKNKTSLFRKLFKLPDKSTTKYSVISGTRRVILEDYDGGYYGDNVFRKKYHDFFKDKLPKGMTVYYEIVGYTPNGTPIMGTCSNDKIKDIEFKRTYGKTTIFSYGCAKGQSDCYVYRMTMTNPDGEVTEIPWEEVEILCEKMGVKCVPTFDKFLFTTEEDLMNRVEAYYDGVDPIGKIHIREGIVVRIDNRSSFTAYKHKNFFFKVLSGIMIDNADADNISDDILSEM